MDKSVSIGIAMAFCGAAAGSTATPQRYIGICQTSAGSFVDANRFAVASDESNVIRIYERGSPTIAASMDLKMCTGHEKSDLEGATVRVDVVYWSAPQSQGSGGKDKRRQVIFATRVVESDDGMTLETRGVVLQGFEAAVGQAVRAIRRQHQRRDLAVTPDGGLLFDFRNLVDDKAAIVKLKSTDQVLAAMIGQAGETAMLDLSGRGIRSLESVGYRYLIVAGKPGDAATVGYALYRWDRKPGHGATAWETQPNFSGIDPGGAMVLEDETALQIVSDDGDRCSEVEEEYPRCDRRGFSSFDVPL